MTGLSDKVLEKIKSGQAKPKPRWRFVLVRNLVLVLIGFALLVSAASISLIFHLIDSFEISRILGRPGWLRLTLASMPYVWLLIFLSVTVIGVAEFLRTRHGYRYRLLHVASGFAILVLSLGGTVFALGGGRILEFYLEEKIPAYSVLTRTPQKFWSQPEEGLISGEIISTDIEKQEMEIRDWEGNTWNVDYSGALWRGEAENLSGEETKIIGEVKDDGKFEAEEVRPWVGHGRVRGTMKEKKAVTQKRQREKISEDRDDEDGEKDEEADSDGVKDDEMLEKLPED